MSREEDSVLVRGEVSVGRESKREEESLGK